MDPGAGMHHHSGRFVDGHQRVVFIQNAQRDGFRFGPQGSQFGGCNIDRIARPQHARRPHSRAIHQRSSAFDPLLYARPAEFGKPLVQRLVQALPDVIPGR